MSESLFDQTDEVVIDETKDFLSELVGEDKRYKTPADLAKAKIHADAHIEALNRSLAELREDLKNRGTTEDLLTAIKSLKNEPAPIPPSNHEQEQQGAKPGLTEADIERLLAEREAKSRKTTNLNTAIGKLKEMHGENFRSVVQAKAKELGVTTEYMQKLAEDSPALFTGLFPARQKDVFAAPPQGQRSSVAAAFAGSGEKYSDYDKVRKADPHKYHTASFQRSLNEAVLRAQSAGRFEEFMNS